ncbi:MAG: gamma-glutamyl-gamma-aminobutyrate hydrolase family protein [Planctomycetota bacterium]
MIGINGDVKNDSAPAIQIELNYIDAVRRAGGIPIVFPAGAPEDVPELLKRVDALILTGGGDMDLRALGIPLHPSVQLMDRRRQDFDFALSNAVLNQQIPTLGICLGMQMLAIAGGGKMYQHLPDSKINNILNHRAEHAVEMDRSSRLASILGVTKTNVVSHHHQGVSEVPRMFKISAHAPDGLIEAFESANGHFLMGVQWHPERSPDSPESQALFKALVDAAMASK